ncbi:MAG TPA: hypothetical protein VG963_18725, partial [Polyangiaceae bacterium]|nr:hypothetical protein [Polyangiaceae bacterium]
MSTWVERVGICAALSCAAVALGGCSEPLSSTDTTQLEVSAAEPAAAASDVGQLTSALSDGSASGISSDERALLASYQEGRNTFRYETFGDEAFWGGKLGLHKAIAGSANGGVGAGVSPKTALALGLKVDADALPSRLQKDLRRGRVDLDDPATTLALLKLNAVVGLTGEFDAKGNIQGIGIQCALCHSTVDDSFASGIGHRLDGWPARDLDIGAIVSAAPDLSFFAGLLGVSQDAVRSVLTSWGPGKFDAFLHLDGKVARPDGKPGAVLIPPLFGLKGVGLMTWNGFSGIGSWVPLVINLEMWGQGVFSDRRLANAAQFPIAAANGFSRVRKTPDLVTPKLAGLLEYVESIRPPAPPCGSFDPDAAARGQALFTGKATCSNCHVPPLYTLPGFNSVPATVIGVDSFQSDRSPNLGYRPPPLR